MEQPVANPPPVHWAFVPLSLLYAAAMRFRNLYYDRVRGATQQARVPVISIGNLTVGGTGKTPLVIEVVRRLREMGRRPAILTRGYRGSPDQPADEVLELQQALPDVPVVVNPDRFAGAAAAHADHAADCVVLDDGFQHRRLRRDLDIVLVDALAPWGGGWTLPAGRLREPLSGLSRAHLLVISRSNQVAAPALAEIHATLQRHAPAPPFVHASVEAERVVRLDGSSAQPDELAGRCVLPVCALGNPLTFLRLVETLAGRSCPPLIFRDHHRYTRSDVATLGAAAQAQKADVVMTSRKDWVKLAALWRRFAGGNVPPLARLDIRLVLADDAGVLDNRLKQAFEASR
jgi:tetraacyldisaccharide 4'-kinase